MENVENVYNERIIHYLDGTATPEEKKQIIAWIQEDEKNGQLFIELKNIWISAFEVYSGDLETETALSAFRQRVHSYRTEASRRKRRRLYHWSIAASLALIIGFSCFYFMTYSLDQDKQATQTCQIHTMDGSKTKIVLEDGTSVWLNTASTLKYPGSFSSETRMIELDGEAYFDVARDEKRPFVIQTEMINVEVLGTRFNLSSYSSDQQATTTLISGAVRVKVKATNEEIILKPDESLLYSGLDTSYVVKAVDADAYTVWASDKLVFDNEILGNVLSKLEHWFKIKINCPEELKNEIRVSFTLRKENKEQTFNALSEVIPIRYIMKESEVTIYAK